MVNDMPRYIDAEKLKRDLIDNRNFYPAIVKRAIENAPTEDVVPRSEVERLQAQKDDLEILVKDLRFRNKELQKANEGLAKNIEELEIENDIVREAYANYEETTGLKQIKQEIERLKRQLEPFKEICCTTCKHLGVGHDHMPCYACKDYDKYIWLSADTEEETTSFWDDAMAIMNDMTNAQVEEAIKFLRSRRNRKPIANHEVTENEHMEKI